MATFYNNRNFVLLILVAASLITMLWNYNYENAALNATQHPMQFNQSHAGTNCTQQLQSRNSSTSPRVPAAKQDPATEKYNTIETEKLQAYLLAANGSLRINGVITILANLPRLGDLRKCLELLYKHFNRAIGYPVVIFHEANFQSNIQQVRSLGISGQRKMSSIFFQQIDMSVPDWQIKKFGQPPKDVCGNSKSIGYRSMCRFQAKLIYEQPVMRHFDYHWRLDDDSFINAKMPYDPFAVLKNGGFSYGFFQSMVDECASNTYNVTEDYMISRKITPTFFNKLKYREVFFNNFEVSSMKLWLSEQYKDYIDYMDFLGGFYTRRWGDAPIKTLALSMFTPLKEVYRLRGLPYFHHSINSPFKTRFQD